VSPQNPSRRISINVTRIALLAAWAILAGGARAQQIGPTAVEVQVLHAPAEVRALGRGHLAYEVHTTNFGMAPVSIEQLDVLDGDAVLARWNGPQFWQRTVVIGDATPPGTARTLGAGQRAVTYARISLAYRPLCWHGDPCLRGERGSSRGCENPFSRPRDRLYVPEFVVVSSTGSGSCCSALPTTR
jgi:hypothetical protein